MTADCEIIVVLDRSGSMAGIRTAMEEGFNKFMEEQKAVPGTCNVSLIQFDSDHTRTPQIEEVYLSKPIDKVPLLSLLPNGGTPLRDALGQTLVKAEQRLLGLPRLGTLADYVTPPGKVVVLVITDGEDNTSSEFLPVKDSKGTVTSDPLKALIERITTEHGWVFSYLGANVDAFAEGAALGVAANSSLNYTPTAHGVNRMYSAVSMSVSAFRGGGSYDLHNQSDDTDLTDLTAQINAMKKGPQVP